MTNDLDIMRRVPKGSHVQREQDSDGTWHVRVWGADLPEIGIGHGFTLADALAMALAQAERGEE